MSKTQAVEYKGNKFWAFDAALAVWLAELISIAEGRQLQNDQWWAKQIHNWKVWSITADFGFSFPDDWSQDQEDLFLELAEKTNETLRLRKQLDAQEVANRKVTIVNDQNISNDEITSAERYRRQETVDVLPIVSLGEAIVQLIRGTLQPAPKGTWWFYGSEPTPSTIEMSGSNGSV